MGKDQCGTCKGEVVDGVCCGRCEVWYDRKCVNLPKTDNVPTAKAVLNHHLMLFLCTVCFENSNEEWRREREGAPSSREDKAVQADVVHPPKGQVETEAKAREVAPIQRPDSSTGHLYSKSKSKSHFHHLSHHGHAQAAKTTTLQGHPATMTSDPKKPKCMIGPSILNADLSNLEKACEEMMASGADYLHLDVMDGHFVPNLTFGPPLVRCLRPKVPDAFFDMHMMVADPEKWVQPIAEAGANQYTFHLEATENPLHLARMIREAGMKAGVAVKPGTPIEGVVPLIDAVDMVLVMTVEPGFGGQAFMADMMTKVAFLRQRFPELDIEVDGGVGLATIDACAQAGANMIVSGSAVVKAEDPKDVISRLRQSIVKAL